MTDRCTQTQKVDTAAARGLLAVMAGGSSGFAGKARQLARFLKAAAEAENGEHILDENALCRAMTLTGLDGKDKSRGEQAAMLADLFLEQLDGPKDELDTMKLVPPSRLVSWQRLNIVPEHVDRTMADALVNSRGGEPDYQKLLLKGLKASLAAGWGSCLIATLCSDILLGTPRPNSLGVGPKTLGPNTVNVVVQDGNPLLAQGMARAAESREVKEAAQKAGADGVMVAGLGFAGCEMLMRPHGTAISGFSSGKKTSLTSAHMLISDGGCVLAQPGKSQLSTKTEILEGVGIFESPEELGTMCRDTLIKAVQSYAPGAKRKQSSADGPQCAVGGLGEQALEYILGGRYRATFRPLSDALIQGRIKGLAAVVGCVDPASKGTKILDICKELIKNDVLVLQTGCAGLVSAQAGLMRPEAAEEYAGPGLQEVCDVVGIPPVLSLGSCLDSARLLAAGLALIGEGGLGEDFSELPIVGAAPEWKSEGAATLGCCFVASGVDVVLGNPVDTAGSDNVAGFLTQAASEHLGASFHIEEEKTAAVEKILTIITERRQNLGIDQRSKRKLFDMKDRRAKHV